MEQITANGRINSNGRLVIEASEKPMLLAQIEKKRGKSVVVKVQIDGNRRSNYQNNYYHSVVVGMVREALLEEWGENLTKDETHELLKQNCNWKEFINEKTGKSLKISQTTTTLSTVEFEEYLERCRRFAAEYLNINIPLPNEQLTLSL